MDAPGALRARVAPILLAGSAAVARADYPVECVGPGNAAKIVCTFTSPGAHGLTLPPGVTSVDADAYGAAGGMGSTISQSSAGSTVRV